jgi:RHS Repeat.
LDAVTTLITYANAFHFVDGANVDDEYLYDKNGNVTKDLNKNITSITYNTLNLPQMVTFSDGNTVTYGYDAAGSKLGVADKSGVPDASPTYHVLP